MNKNWFCKLLFCFVFLTALPMSYAQVTDSLPLTEDQISTDDNRTAVILSLDEYAPKRKKKKKTKEPKHAVGPLEKDSTEIANSNIKNPKKGAKETIEMPIDVALRSNCREAYNQVDEFTGKRKRALETRWFFSYTPKRYANFFGNSDYLYCEGNLAESDGNYILQLIIKVQGRDVQRQFGTISPQSELILRSLKGNALALTTLQGAKVTVAKELTIYEVSYSISKSNLRNLKNFELDSIRIVWSNGFQDYEIYYLDFIRDQLACFDLL